MTRPIFGPDDAILHELADLRRQVADIRAARVPQISNIMGGFAAASIATNEDTGASSIVPTFGDLATVGPTVEVTVRRDGLVAFWRCNVNPNGVDTTVVGYMTIEVTDLTTNTIVHSAALADAVLGWANARIATFRFVALPPGRYRVRAKYGYDLGPGYWNAFVSNRHLAVLPL